MDQRRSSRPAIDPVVRHVGFFTPNLQPGRTLSAPPDSASPLATSPASDSLSPVMIPPPRHLSDNLALRSAALPVPESGLRRNSEEVPVGSYDPSELLLGTSPSWSSSSRLGAGDLDFSEESSTIVWHRPNETRKLATSVPVAGLGLSAAKSVEAKKPVKISGSFAERTEESASEAQHELSSIPKKVKTTTKAERRALQEAQRAAKAEGSKPVGASSGKPTQPRSKKKDGPPASPLVAATDKKGGDRAQEKNKDAPPPRMQFDEKSRVEKAKRRSVVNQSEATNRVELFLHLPQYERGTQLLDLESKFFQLEAVHPAVYKVGLQYLRRVISGGNARCISMLQAFQEAIKDYSTPPEKTLARDLTAKLSSSVSFFNECRPLSVSMGNAIRFLKNRIAKLPLSLSESEAKSALFCDINRFINEKIVLADMVIVRHAVTKIRDGDVLLIYRSSCVVEMVLLYAHELGKRFRTLVVDSRPNFDGQALLRRLLLKGLSCTYTHINAVSYVMHEVTRVFLGASSILSNGTVYSRVGTASIAMVAHSFRVPVLVCCEAYKFHERVQLDSICFNELGDSNEISLVPGRSDVNYLNDWTNKDHLQLLNLMYDVTPSDYISMIVTDYGMIPPTSVPVIVREYRRDQVWI